MRSPAEQIASFFWFFNFAPVTRRELIRLYNPAAGSIEDLCVTEQEALLKWLDERAVSVTNWGLRRALEKAPVRAEAEGEKRAA
jgi:hypothetical protein